MPAAGGAGAGARLVRKWEWLHTGAAGGAAAQQCGSAHAARFPIVAGAQHCG